MRKKNFLTLLEIMIVIALITIIGGVLGYNMKGSLEKGKAFKTEQAIKQIDDILSVQYTIEGSWEDPLITPVIKNAATCVPICQPSARSAIEP